MAINDYLGEKAQTPQRGSQRGTSRREFLTGLGALIAGTYLPTQSFSQEQERKIPAEYEQDKRILTEESKWQDETSRTEYNQLSVQYMEVLMQKGKYDPEKKEALKKSIKEILKGKSPKEKVEIMKRELMCESDPEKYLKTYIKTLEERFDIKALKYDSRTKKTVEQYAETLQIDQLKLDLSDKIKVYNSFNSNYIARSLEKAEAEKYREPINKAIVSPLIKFFESIGRK